MRELLMDVQNISKKFPGVQALKDVCFPVYEGEIHALVGENGAGKSTLMNILSGVYEQTEGKLIWKGKEVRFKDTREPKKLGIAMIHQELSLASHLSVMENIFMGRLPKKKSGFIDYEKLKTDTGKALERVGLEEELAFVRVDRLSVSRQQMVEIARALSMDAKMIIMDEPSSSLTQSETRTLLNLIKELRSQGVAIIYISHRMDEVFEIAERITILRDGCVVNSYMAGDVTINEVLSRMVGREYKMEKLHKCNADYRAEPVLRVEHLTYKNIFRDISFSLYPAEVLVITGLVGAGRSELLETVFGYRQQEAGTVYLDGESVNNKNPGVMMSKGLAIVPEGRKINGIFPQLSVYDNMRISSLGRYKKAGILNNAAIRRDVNRQVDAMNIKTPSVCQKIKYLSGGNQQKVILGRCMMCTPKVLIMDEPTNGIDIGAKQEIYKIINVLSQNGMSIICISSEMQEVLTIADRIIVMHEGRITGEMKNENVTQDMIMRYASDQMKNT
ncbi:MAG: sugar ABC transporter ATP-binding protein [Lachnospiraceae bacterium]|jgi:ABC-type sugar transport system ATPase subunit|nr:sugar ABC transporter ATP-binding protein [Lachnospiraceae bacterium]